MTPEERSRLEQLLAGQRLLALAVVVDGEPVVGLLPFARSSDGAALIVQASRLARHSQGLRAGGQWSGVIHEPLAEDGDPLQVARLVVEGGVVPLPKPSVELDDAARVFVARFAGAGQTLALPDFSLYRLEIEGGRLILGFGRALNLGRSSFVDQGAV